MDVIIDGTRYRPVDGAEAEELATRINEFTLEASDYWRDRFNDDDTNGMYADGDEHAPFFSEAFLYNLLGKYEARSVLGIVRRLSKLAGVQVDI